ncbi:MAG TPA: PfkB family carbohydrate kinase [Solirubrobacteraceae bacterium]|nr:PfkB family carbohydrate kinase [Solirubrobacteraceae bacterium]
MPRYDYVTLGHVTADVLAADGSRRPGGTAFYSALQAARLELRTLILTKGNPQEIEALLDPYRSEFDLTVLPAEHTTTLRTSGAGSERRQRLLAWAGPIAGPIEVDTAILHLAPVARETPRVWFDGHSRRTSFVGLTPQGLVRQWDAQGEISPAPLQRELFPERCDALVLSEHELASCGELISAAFADRTPMATTPADRAPIPTAPADRAPIPTIPGDRALVAITAGAQPTTLRLPDGRLLHVPVPPIEAPLDDLGAGDVFTAGLFIALREGRPPAEAAAFANAAAAVRISGAGPGAIGDRRAIEARLETTTRAGD